MEKEIDDGKVALEEYSVYTSLVESYLSSIHPEMLVISDHTSVPSRTTLGRRPYTEYIAGLTQYLAREIPDIASEILADFEAKNQKDHRLECRFNFRIDYVLISDKDKESIRKSIDHPRDFWRAFYRKYRKADGRIGIITFSRVGFNDRMDQALVYMDHRSGMLSGLGLYVLLNKSNGTWIVQHTIQAWIS